MGLRQRIATGSARSAPLLLAATVALLAGCSDYATETQLKRVERHVDRVDDRTRRQADQFGNDLSSTSYQIERIVLKQAETDQTFADMGRGFNVLSEAVAQADEKSTKVERRQDRLERAVSRQLNIDLRTGDKSKSDDVVLRGTGTDIKSGDALDTLWLTLGQTETLQIERTGGAASPQMAVQRAGQRIYAVGSDPADAICLDILQRNDTGEGFDASVCEQPFRLYDFELSE